MTDRPEGVADGRKGVYRQQRESSTVYRHWQKSQLTAMKPQPQVQADSEYRRRGDESRLNRKRKSLLSPVMRRERDLHDRHRRGLVATRVSVTESSTDTITTTGKTVGVRAP